MADVHDNPGAHRYELAVDGEVGAFVNYRMHGEVIELVHTETVPGFEGRGLAKELVADTLDDVRRRGWQVRPSCAFVRGFIERNPQYADLVATP
jgi:predicted GNAT family acetyltransferase